MADTDTPDGAESDEQAGTSSGEAEAPLPRNADSWAAKVDRLQVEQRPGVRGTNVHGRQLMGPVQGFGKMWQKTYRMEVGPDIGPADAIGVWRAHFAEFWPRGNRFAGPVTGINPGDVALLDLAMSGGVKLSTGVFVLYADEESFTLMTPQGHTLAGWITFSAEQAAGTTAVQAQVLMRANDPIYEIAMALVGHRKEDQFWVATMTALGQRLGVRYPQVHASSICVDPRRQWSCAGNIRHNSMVRSVLQTVVARAAVAGRFVRRGRSHAEGQVGGRRGGAT